MFAYCGNNPVVNKDSTGMLFERTAGGGGRAYIPVNYIGTESQSAKSNLSLNDFKNLDGTVSLYDSRRHLPSSNPFFEQAFWVGASGPSLDPLSLATIKAGLYRGAGDYKYGRFNVSIVEAVADIGIKDNEAGLFGMASILKGELSGKIPTPFGTLVIGAEGYWGSVGAGLVISNLENGFKLKAGGSLGIGGSFVLEWDGN